MRHKRTYADYQHWQQAFCKQWSDGNHYHQNNGNRHKSIEEHPCANLVLIRCPDEMYPSYSCKDDEDDLLCEHSHRDMRVIENRFRIYQVVKVVD